MYQVRLSQSVRPPVVAMHSVHNSLKGGGTLVLFFLTILSKPIHWVLLCGLMSSYEYLQKIKKNLIIPYGVQIKWQLSRDELLSSSFTYFELTDFLVSWKHFSDIYRISSTMQSYPMHSKPTKTLVLAQSSLLGWNLFLYPRDKSFNSSCQTSDTVLEI